MRIAILAPGPSLARYQPGEHDLRHDLRIAINLAATIHRCDWWTVGDWQAIECMTELGTPDIYTMPSSVDAAQSRRAGRHVLAWSQPLQFSAPAALVLARDLGATAIDCYGVDMAGTTYVDGSTNKCLTDRRWQHEQRLWDEQVHLLRHAGVAVTRHQASVSEVAA
jgi:hypothetical protein